MNTAITKPSSFQRLQKEEEYSIHEAGENIKMWVESIKGLAARLSSHLESVNQSAWSGGAAEHHDVRVLVSAIDGLCHAIVQVTDLDILDATREGDDLAG
jgi:hypothetical protein